MIKNTIYYLLTFVCLAVYADPGLFGMEASNEVSTLFGGAERIERDYDRSELDDFVAYRLYALDPEADYYNRAFYHIYTVSYLSKEVAEESIIEQIDRLYATIDESYKTVAIDEGLRQEVVGLAESVKTLQLITAKESRLQKQAMEAIEKGLDRYAELRRQSHRYAMKQQRLATNSEERLLTEMIDFASTPGMISDYALLYEEHFETSPWTKVKEACGATANALYIFFQEKGLIVSEKESRQGIDALISRIESNQSSKNGILYQIDAAKLDHVFTIQQTADGRYRILQSFINRYSLFANLTEQQTFSRQEMLNFCHKLQQLLAMERWNAQSEELYRQLFLTTPAPHVAQEYSQPANFSFTELSYKLSN